MSVTYQIVGETTFMYLYGRGNLFKCIASIDTKDLELVKQKRSWSAFKSGKHFRVVSSDQVILHNWILGGDKKIIHKDKRTLHNRRCNLVKTENVLQESKQRRTSGVSKYRGVSFNLHTGKWQSQITFRKKVKHLGYYKEEVLAAHAYNEAAILVYGQNAVLNKLS